MKASDPYYSCEICGDECQAYKDRLRSSKDEIDVYLARHTVPENCPKRKTEGEQK